MPYRTSKDSRKRQSQRGRVAMVVEEKPEKSDLWELRREQAFITDKGETL